MPDNGIRAGAGEGVVLPDRRPGAPVRAKVLPCPDGKAEAGEHDEQAGDGDRQGVGKYTIVVKPRGEQGKDDHDGGDRDDRAEEERAPG